MAAKMTSYAFWNNKGGVGKSFLCFIAACEYAHRNPESDVYAIDLCPQANLSEILLGGFPNGPKVLNQFLAASRRRTIAGFIEARLNSPFQMVDDIGLYLSHPQKYNSSIPDNLNLICGDNLLEVLSEPVRQTSQLSIPVDAWKQVLSWVKDLTVALEQRSGSREAIFVIDCNPSFAVYTQLAIVAANRIVVPFTADDSSRRAIENVVALLYGIGDSHTASYARISFSKRAKDEGLVIPKLHAFVSNRMTIYEGKPSKAFRAVSKTIRETMDGIHSKNRHIFANPKHKPSNDFIDIPDYHGASIVAATMGTPLHRLKAGPKKLLGERVQINQEPLNRYKAALGELIDCL